MSEPSPPSRPKRGWQALFLVVVACALLWLAYHLRAILTPLLVALGLAYMLNPAVTWLERRGLPRVGAIAVLYGVALALVAVILDFAVPPLVDQGATFVHDHLAGEAFEDADGDGSWDEGERFTDANNNGRCDPPKIARVLDWSRDRLEQLTGKGFAENLRDFRDKVRGKEGDIAQAAGRVLGACFRGLSASLGGILTFIGFVVLVPVYTFFILKGMNELWARVQAAIPTAYRERVVATLGRIHRANASFFRGQVTISLIEAAIMFVVLTALGVRMSFLFAALYGVLSMVPYVGVFSMFVLTELFVFVDTGGFTGTFWMVAGLFLFVQLLENLVLQPFILGKETGLHPVAIMLSIMIFGELFGFFGMLLAIPLASATIIVVQDYVRPVVRDVTEDAP